MKVIIFGATGTGKTTLGNSLSEKLNWKYLDSDEYYWMKTNPPFQNKIPLEIRNENLKTDFKKEKNVFVSGSLCTWSKYWDRVFDLGIFLRVPKETRMERLKIREIERYGEALNNDPVVQATSIEFLEWAGQYDDYNKNDGHNISQHLNWIDELDCPVLEINGTMTVYERVEIVRNKIESYLQNDF